MLLQPRYDGPCVLRLEVVEDDPGRSLIRQRTRLAEVLGSFGEDEWAAPSRCEGWSARDVVIHLVSTNQFWAVSMAAGLRGDPTRFLATFDPVSGPAGLVERERSVSATEALDRFRHTLGDLSAVVGEVDDWNAVAEAPPGHVSMAAVASHALWDSWVHERDILMPLGMTQVEEPDEIAVCLRYAAGLSPALAVIGGTARRGTFVVAGTDPAVAVQVDIDGDGVVIRERTGGATPASLTGSSVGLVDGLSFRAEIPCEVADEDRWVLGGLAEVFERT